MQVTNLPPHVRIVVSTLPDDGERSRFQCLSMLRRRLAGTHEQFVEVRTIAQNSGRTVLTYLLRKRGRCITSEQQARPSRRVRRTFCAGA